MTVIQKIVLKLFIFQLILFACSRKSVPLIFDSKILNSETSESNSIEAELSYWKELFDSSTHGYYVRQKSHIPLLEDHFFFLLHNENLSFKAFHQNYQTKKYMLTEASYPVETLNTVDSLVSGFWDKPGKVPLNGSILDGGETEMTGKLHDNVHRVTRSIPSTRDPEFDSLAKIISQQLYWNTIIKHQNQIESK